MKYIIKNNNYSLIFEEYNNFEDTNFLEAFNHCKEINDIDNIKNIINNKNIFYNIYNDNDYLGFIMIYYKPSLNAHGFSTFIHPNTSARSFKTIIRLSCGLIYYLLNNFNDDKYNLYFDVANLRIAQWVKEVTLTLNIHHIYDQYVVCYCTISKENLLRILYSYDIEQC